jgi:cis-3-alkyl-4-acyloxetan-2-one decarboxylase
MVAIMAEFRGRFIDIGGFAMHYRDEGAGPPVICLHGNPTWSYMYRDVIVTLRSTHRVLAFDHIGCGFSDKPPRQKYPYTLARRIADFETFISALIPTGRLSLIVHDWGGMIGLAWAVENSDRIEKLVIMNTAAFPIPAGKRLPGSLQIGRIPLLGPLFIQGFNLFCRGAVRYCVVRQPLPPDVRTMYLMPYDSWTNRLAVERFVATIPVRQSDDGYDILAKTEIGLANLGHCPMMLLWGLRDFVFDADYLNEWRGRFPKAEVHAVADAGHYLLEDAGTELIPHIVRFMAA